MMKMSNGKIWLHTTIITAVMFGVSSLWGLFASTVINLVIAGVLPVPVEIGVLVSAVSVAGIFVVAALYVLLAILYVSFVVKQRVQIPALLGIEAAAVVLLWVLNLFLKLGIQFSIHGRPDLIETVVMVSNTVGWVLRMGVVFVKSFIFLRYNEFRRTQAEPRDMRP